MNEIVQFLKSKEAKRFGTLISVGILIAVGSTVVNKFYTNRVLIQQSKINKYKLTELKKGLSPKQQEAIEEEKF